eukprot:Hpha_TRINITY_DN15416_c1_g6::TRINITY_DN15416_c1_g6_i1::g.176972::m.176972/K11583/PPP2R3; serine/threonine-protein phosphatase 2A regulatory subunit B''
MALTEMLGAPAPWGRRPGGQAGAEAAKLKLNELYAAWLVLPETQSFIAKFANPQQMQKRDSLSIVVEQVDRERAKSPNASAHLFGSHPPRSPRSPNISPAAPPKRRAVSPLVDEMDVAHRAGGLSPCSSPRQGGSPQPPRSPAAGLGVAGAAAAAFAGVSLTPTTAKRTPPAPKRRLSNEPRVAVPQFYFPKGKPLAREEVERQQQQMRRVWEARKPSRGNAAVTTRTSGGVQTAPRKNSTGGSEMRSFTLKTFPDVAAKACGLPKWMSALVFRRILAWDASDSGAGWKTREKSVSVHPTNTVLHYQRFKDFYDAELAGKSPERRLFDLIKCDGSRDHLLKEDLRPIVEEVLNVHSGLEFLKQTPDFQERYADTVQIRMFYTANLKDDGKLSWHEWRRSSLPVVLAALDEETDINMSQRTEFFSYEHFYVLYCKFWELDTDHDFLISRDDLARYGNYALTSAIIDRVFAGKGRRRKPTCPGKMTYDEFLWFCLCEEDKGSAQSVQYWFRCVDLDGDGALSGYELTHFFAEQKARMEASYQETVAWEDILCQMVDIIKPRSKVCIVMSDVHRCKLSGNFFNALFNLNKFIAFEQRDPFAAHAERQLPEKTEWDRFAKVEYERMSHEAGEEDAALRDYGTLGNWRADAG